MIRAAQLADVPAIVSVHMESFPGFFLTFLGTEFLRVLYTKTLALPEAIAFVAGNNGTGLVGFVIGVTSQTSFYRTLLQKYWTDFARVSMGPALRHPRIVPRLVRALRRPQETQRATADCLLMSIAVRPEIQGHQIGMQLVHAFLAEAQRRGVRVVSLTTDRDENERANRFYQRQGFDVARSYVTSEGRWMNEYLIDLPTWSLHQEEH